MVEKKYKLLKTDIPGHGGSRVYRLQAIRDFGDVKKGDLGGTIQSEWNLSHLGDCWVYEGAQVADTARVYGNAKVSGRARVYDTARVYENAKVSGHACVYANSRVFGNARVLGMGFLGLGDKVSGNDRVVGYLYEKSKKCSKCGR